VMGLYQKLGLSVETVSRGRNAEMLSPFRDFTPEEQARYQAQLDDFYRVFVSRVSDGRGMTAAAVDSIGRGRVWSGASALRLGLVDTLGGMRTAVGVARVRAGIGEDEAISLELYPHPRRSFFREVLETVFDEPEQDAEMRVLSPVFAAWLAASKFPAGATLALLPYTLDIR